VADQPVAVVEIVVEFLKKIPNGDWLYHPSWLLPLIVVEFLYLKDLGSAQL
jgi:hypothetical protein